MIVYVLCALCAVVYCIQMAVVEGPPSNAWLSEFTAPGTGPGFCAFHAFYAFGFIFRNRGHCKRYAVTPTRMPGLGFALTVRERSVARCVGRDSHRDMLLK